MSSTPATTVRTRRNPPVEPDQSDVDKAKILVVRSIEQGSVKDPRFQPDPELQAQNEVVIALYLAAMKVLLERADKPIIATNWYGFVALHYHLMRAGKLQLVVETLRGLGFGDSNGLFTEAADENPMLISIIRLSQHMAH